MQRFSSVGVAYLRKLLYWRIHSYQRLPQSKRGDRSKSKLVLDRSKRAEGLPSLLSFTASKHLDLDRLDKRDKDRDMDIGEVKEEVSSADAILEGGG